MCVSPLVAFLQYDTSEHTRLNRDDKYKHLKRLTLKKHKPKINVRGDVRQTGARAHTHTCGSHFTPKSKQIRDDIVHKENGVHFWHLLNVLHHEKFS